MKNFLNPKWLLLINTAPIVFLLLLGWYEFGIIRSLLDEENLRLWKSFAIAIVGLGGITLIYAIVQMVKHEKLTIAYSLVSLILYLAFIYIYYYNISDIIPWNIPTWLTSDNIHLYVSAALMPTLAHSVIILVVLLTPSLEKKVALKSFAVAILIPISFYLFVVLILPLFHGFRSDSGIHFIAVSLVIGTVVFMFFLVRGIYILLSRRNFDSKYALFWKIPISIILPLVGLTVNTISFDNMFGDFSNPWYFILALVNGVFLCLPALNNKMYRLFLFLGRCITFTFTLYFFVVFLPFLPFSIVAIILVGLGFLMLTPLILFVLHVEELYNDVLFLKRKLPTVLIGSICIVGFMVIPLGMTFSFIRDRSMLNQTLEYLYSPDYLKSYTINKQTVNRVLENVNDRTQSFSLLYSNTPYIASYYRWLVLDNLNLSASRKIMINQVFNGDDHIKLESGRRRGTSIAESDREIHISDIKQRSHYDTDQQAWISWVDLSIRNENTSLWNSEYRTQFTLPDGCWISNYYLDVEGMRKYGLLSEKKSAMWIFQQVRNEIQDPGILTYMGGNDIEFKVFPFQKQETRLTGIEFIHKEPVEIVVDGYTILLGDQSIPSLVNAVEVNNVAYVSADKKMELKKVKPKPYYHFIVDISDNSRLYHEGDEFDTDKLDKDLNIYVGRIQNLLDNGVICKDGAKISYVNSTVETKELQDDWGQELVNKQLDGGFFLDRAIKKAICNNFSKGDGSQYPVFVVVSDFWTNNIWNRDIKDLQFAYPYQNLGYALFGNELQSFDLFGSTFLLDDSIVTSVPLCEVLEYQFSDQNKVFLPQDTLSSVIINPSLVVWEGSINDIEEKKWRSALLQQGQWMQQTLYPYLAKDEWIDLVRSSFQSKVMTPLTSYIVLENEAQEAMLIKKQKQVLAGNKNLDLEDENTVRMSEPELYVLLILLTIFLLIVQKKRKS